MSLPNIIPSFPNLNQIGVEYFINTTDDTPTELFRIPTELNSTGKFNAQVQCIDSLASFKSGWVREIIARNSGNTLFIGTEHATFTDKTEAPLLLAYWENVGFDVRFMVQGIAATNITWSGLISYQFTKL